MKPVKPEIMSHYDQEPEEAALTDNKATASQWKLMAAKFRRHKLAMIGLMILLMLYLAAALAGMLSPYAPDSRQTAYTYAPPQPVRIWDGESLRRPFVYPLMAQRDDISLEKIYPEDRSNPQPLRFGVRGDRYHFLGMVETDWHLFGVDEGTVFLLGTDQLGRDLFTRLIHGARISLTIGLIGVALSFVLGLIIGAISGYYGGWIDNAIQRLIEVIQSFPTIPLWMALSAALPRTWSPIQIYLGITIVLSLVGWTGLARQVRGKLLALREEDYATAARLAGASEPRIIFRHLLPAFASHIVVTLTLMVPGMILGETALSFLGLGLQPPATSWGVLLQDAQNVQALTLYPWLMAPVFMVIITVLAFNFVGDGLRDAADPYTR